MSSTTLDAHMPPWGPGRVFPLHMEVMPDEIPCVLALSPEAFMGRSGAPPSETGPFLARESRGAPLSRRIWADLEAGIAVVVISNYFPWLDEGWQKLADEVKGAIREWLE